MDHLKAYPEESKSVERGASERITVEGKAGISVPVLLELGGSVGKSSGDAEARAHTIARSRPLHLVAKAS